MKVRAQIMMVMNLDKCIGCHTCSVTCKNVWTERDGMEYAWFNNVETKPGIGYPKQWEDQERWNGGWERRADGTLQPKIGGRLKVMSKLFANPDLPEIDEYYEPFEYDYAELQSSQTRTSVPQARPVSKLTGKPMDKVEWGPNWEDDLGGEFEKRVDVNFDQIQAEVHAKFEKSFMMYLPRLCEHCLNPSCVAACPSGSIYKREEDGIVLIDQNECRGWRMCISGCPYKKIYFNWKTGKSEKCILCYPRLEVGEPTVCSETCVGRIRYLGVILYDADRIAEAAAVEHTGDLYEAQLGAFLDPADPAVQAAARRDGIHDEWIAAAERSPVYKLCAEWKIAFPLHPEYRTLPMVWYVPPLSPMQDAVAQGYVGWDGAIPDVRSMQIPVRYLANLLTAGEERPVVEALERMFAMRIFMRSRHVESRENLEVLEQAGLTKEQVEAMYRLLAIAKFEDRFAIPTRHREVSAELAALEGRPEAGGCSISAEVGGGCGAPAHGSGGCGGGNAPRLFQIGS